MKLSKKAIECILQHSSEIKLKLALALGCSESTINRYLRENDDNLTKAAALEIIRKETGLTDDEILEKNTNVKEPQDNESNTSQHISITVTIK